MCIGEFVIYAYSKYTEYKGLELVDNVFKSFLARYVERKFTKKAVLLVPVPDTDIGITALLLKLQSSNSRRNIAVN